jgi:hypothetical protein
MARKVKKGIIDMYEIIEFFRGAEVKRHGPFEGEWQAKNKLATLLELDEPGVEYQIIQKP